MDETKETLEVPKEMDVRSGSGVKRPADGVPEVPGAMDASALEEMESVIHELGFFGVHVSELFGPGKFTSRAESFGLNPGHAFDLRLTDDNGVPWDLSDPKRQKVCEATIDRERPYLIIGSPMCRAFSTIMSLNKDRDPEAYEQKVIEGIQHLRFCAKIYTKQVKEGRYFLHEHPDRAWSWKLDFMVELSKMKGVSRVEGHQCCWGQQTVDFNGEMGLVLKPTGWMSNSECILKEVSRRCENENLPRNEWHTHVHLVGSSRTRPAQDYPPALVAAILKGLTAQLRVDGDLSELTVGVTCEEDAVTWDMEEYEEFRDNITGQVLDAKLVRAGREEELRYMDEMKVYEVVPESMCHEETKAKPIQVKWVDINKGDETRPEIRCRLVAKELKSAQTKAGIFRDDVFSATPPQEGVKMLFSKMMSRRRGDCRRRKLMFIDISRAHFHSPARRRVFVQLPAERRREGYCALLLKSMYGTRDAAANFADKVMEVLRDMGFKIGVFCPCLCKHDEKDIMLFYHGDDFVSEGDDDALEWFKVELSKRLLVKVRGVLGWDEGDVKEVTLLNRIVRLTETEDGDPCLQWEADARHVEIILAQLKLKPGEGSKSVTSPGIKRTAEELERSEDLGPAEASLFRSVCMRINYLAMDRIDLLFAAKEAARWMSRPTQTALEMVKRIGRYLMRRPRVVQQFVQQTEPSVLTVACDSDHAGCVLTRRSTTGIALYHGKHLLKASANTQSVIALSSGESEFYAIVRGTSVGLGAQSMCEDFGMKKDLIIETDATAGRGMALRLGAGKVRHLHTQYLWVQGVFHQKRARLNKVPGNHNTADMMTKHLNGETIDFFLDRCGFIIMQGRSKLSLKAAM
jgi:hypothetical protein